MKVISAKFPGYCELGDHDIRPGDQVENYDGEWVHHECADKERKEIKDADKRERKELEQSWRIGSPETRMDTIIAYARSEWPNIEAAECEVRRRRSGDGLDVWIKYPCLRIVGGGTVGGDKIKQYDERLFWAFYDALTEMACELDYGDDGVWYWAK